MMLRESCGSWSAEPGGNPRRPSAGVISGQFERHHRSEAVADRGDPGGIGPRLGRDDLQRGAADRSHPGRARSQVLEPGHHRGVTVRAGAAMVIRSEDGIAELGEQAARVQFVACQSAGLVEVGTGGPSFLASGKEQAAGHERVVCGVPNVAALQHRATIFLCVVRGPGCPAGSRRRCLMATELPRSGRRPVQEPPVSAAGADPNPVVATEFGARKEILQACRIPFMPRIEPTWRQPPPAPYRALGARGDRQC